MRILLAVLGLCAVLALLLILSSRIVRPVAESYEKQRRFITDAGHELKTPMTIISADVDLAEMDCGENQWLIDIRRQTQRLTSLTADLIYLSRMEEEQPRLSPIEFPLSDAVEEIAQSFAALATSQGKAFSIRVQPMPAQAHALAAVLVQLNTSREFQIYDNSEIILGKGSQANIIVANPVISRAHARIVCRNGVCTIEDLNSKNGTFLNDQKLNPGQPATLTSGAYITLGNEMFGYKE